jgi:hypothetical protein
VVGDRAEIGGEGGVRMRFKNISGVDPAKAGTHTPCPLDRLRRLGPGSTSAFTRVFDALWAGTTAIPGLPIMRTA